MAPLAAAVAAMDSSLLPSCSVSFPSLSGCKCPCSKLSFLRSFSTDEASGFSGRLRISAPSWSAVKHLRQRKRGVVAVGTFPQVERRESNAGERYGRNSGTNPRDRRYGGRDGSNVNGRKFVITEKPRVPRGGKAPKNLILKPPMDDTRLAEKLLSSPQLALKKLPLLSSCLPGQPLRKSDLEWIEENMLELKDALGYPLEGMEDPAEDSAVAHLETLLYLAFQHENTARYKKAHYVRNGHTRLAFLGQYVMEMAMTELLLQMFPRDTTGCTRERNYLLTGKKYLPDWVKAASMDRLIFPDEHVEDIGRLKKHIREPSVKSTVSALIAAVYLTLGLGEVYRVLFEVFGMDPHAKNCQPKARSQLEDIDYLSPELDKKLTWQDIAFYEPPPASIFAKPRLFRACVPPGIHRLRGSLWEEESLPTVKQVLGYPRPVPGTREEVEARNLELDLGLQLCFLHPSKYKFEHPRFCNERLELLGSRVMDVIMAERLLMKQLMGPGDWLEVKHRKLLMNRVCGRLLRDRKLGRYIIYSDERILAFERVRRLRNLTTSGVQQAIHGLGYLVYGRAEVRRLMFEVFDTEAGPMEQKLMSVPYRPSQPVLSQGYPPSQGRSPSQFQYPPNYQSQLQPYSRPPSAYRPPRQPSLQSDTQAGSP